MILLIENHAIPSDAIVDVTIENRNLVIHLIGGREVNLKEPNPTKELREQFSDDKYWNMYWDYCWEENERRVQQIFQAIDPNTKFLTIKFDE